MTTYLDPKVHVRKDTQPSPDERQVFCCGLGIGKTKRSSHLNPNTGKVSVQIGKDRRGVLYPRNTPLVLDQSGGKTVLRPKKLPKEIIKNDERNQEAIATYYDEQVKAHGSDIIAVVSAWKSINFFEMSSSIRHLKPSYKETINTAIEELKPVKDAFNFVMKSIHTFLPDKNLPRQSFIMQPPLESKNESRSRRNSFAEEKFLAVAKKVAGLEKGQIQIIAQKLKFFSNRHEQPVQFKELVDSKKIVPALTLANAEALLKIVKSVHDKWQELLGDGSEFSTQVNLNNAIDALAGFGLKSFDSESVYTMKLPDEPTTLKDLSGKILNLSHIRSADDECLKICKTEST